MRHGFRHRKFNRTSSHRFMMFRNMVTSLLLHEYIKTTLPKAKDLRPIAEKMITLGKRYINEPESRLHIRRLALSYVKDESAVNKLFENIAVRFKERKGGYLRILKSGRRYGDNAPTAIISMVDYVPKIIENKKKSEETS